MPHLILPSRRYHAFRIPVWYYLDSTSTLDRAIISGAKAWGWQVEAVEERSLASWTSSRHLKVRKGPKWDVFRVWEEEHGRRIVEKDIAKGGKRTNKYRAGRVVDWLYQRGEGAASLPDASRATERHDRGEREQDAWEGPPRFGGRCDFCSSRHDGPWAGGTPDFFSGQGEACPLGHLCPRAESVQHDPFSGHKSSSSSRGEGAVAIEQRSLHATSDLIDLNSPARSIASAVPRGSRGSGVSQLSRRPSLFRSASSNSLYSQRSAQSAPSYTTGHLHSWFSSDSDNASASGSSYTLQRQSSSRLSRDRIYELTDQFRWRSSKEGRLERAIEKRRLGDEKRGYRLTDYSTKRQKIVKKLLAIRWM